MKVHGKIFQHLLGGCVGLIMYFGWKHAKIVHPTMFN